MAAATIIETKFDNAWAWMWVRVSGDRVINGQALDVEYQGRVPVAQLQGLTALQIRAALIQAAKDARTASIAAAQPSPTDLGITGTVVV